MVLWSQDLKLVHWGYNYAAKADIASQSLTLNHSSESGSGLSNASRVCSRQPLPIRAHKIKPIFKCEPVYGLFVGRTPPYKSICLSADDTTLMAENEEELKSLLMKVKEESENVGFKAQHSENKDYGIWSYHFMGNRWGNSGNSLRLYFGGASKSLQMVTAAMKLKDTYSLEEKL